MKYLDLLKNVFFTAMMFFGSTLLNLNPLKCVSMNNQECRIRTKIKYINNNEPLF